MSGNEKPTGGCKIGKVKPKAQVFEVESIRPSKSAVRTLLVNAIKAIDEGALPENGATLPIVGFFGMVHSDGKVDLDFTCEEDPSKEEFPHIPYTNWRNLVMLLEDAAQDIRNFGLYRQLTPYGALTTEEED